MANWEFYQAGEKIGGAWVQVLKVLRYAPHMTRTWYRVRFLCCGREDDLSHAAIRARAKRNRHRCKECRVAKPAVGGGQKKKPLVREKYPLEPRAAWPVPPMAMGLRPGRLVGVRR